MERRDAEEGAKRHDRMQMECGMKRMEKKRDTAQRRTDNKNIWWQDDY